ncbi:unnamed protein product [Trichobilharzia regenti]|nr:unnamed protein product [Trichobilharzia regenti]
MFPTPTKHIEPPWRAIKRQEHDNLHTPNSHHIPPIQSDGVKLTTVNKNDSCLSYRDAPKSGVNSSGNNQKQSTNTSFIRQPSKTSLHHSHIYYRKPRDFQLPINLSNGNFRNRSNSLGSLSGRPPFYPPGPQSWDDLGIRSNPLRIKRIQLSREWYRNANSIKNINNIKISNVPLENKVVKVDSSPLRNITNHRSSSVDRTKMNRLSRPRESLRYHRPHSSSSLWSLNHMNEGSKVKTSSQEVIHSPFWCTNDKRSVCSCSHSTDSLNLKIPKYLSKSVYHDSIRRGTYDLGKNEFGYKPYFQSLRRLDLNTSTASTNHGNLLLVTQPSYSTSNLLNTNHNDDHLQNKINNYQLVTGNFHVNKPPDSIITTKDSTRTATTTPSIRSLVKPNYRSCVYKSIGSTSEKYISNLFYYNPKYITIHNDDDDYGFMSSLYGHIAKVTTTGENQKMDLLKGRIIHDLTFVPVGTTLPWWEKTSQSLTPSSFYPGSRSMSIGFHLPY